MATPPEQTGGHFVPPNYSQSMADLAKNFVGYGYPDKSKWRERLPEVARLQEHEHVKFPLGEIQQEILRAKASGKSVQTVLKRYTPADIADLIKVHTIATNREGGLGRAELLKSTQLQVTSFPGAVAKRGFWSRVIHPFRKEA